MEDSRNIKYYIDEDYKNANVSLFFKNTYVYGWGKNKYGELGLGHSNDANIPT
jgi:alpha-tubulin suppressor-like RCC1 family protein